MLVCTLENNWLPGQSSHPWGFLARENLGREIISKSEYLQRLARLVCDVPGFLIFMGQFFVHRKTATFLKSFLYCLCSANVNIPANEID